VRFGAKAVALRLRLAALVRDRSMPDILRELTPSTPRSPRATPLPSLGRALTASEALFARVPVAPDTCLYRALARYAILRSGGHPARFVMGIRPGQPEITGHAWVEIEGRPYREDVDPGLVVTYSYPAGL
jgi:hypothetical protein